jgi:predicted DNA-binding protein (MmcQ/YjbR family)
MNVEWIRRHCLSLPHTTETVQWGNNLVFKVGGRIYAIVALEPAAHCISFKCTQEGYAELIEREGIVPAPYLARAHWVALESFEAVPPAELKELLRLGYELVFAKLPKKVRTALGAAGADSGRERSGGTRGRRSPARRSRGA